MPVGPFGYENPNEFPPLPQPGPDRFPGSIRGLLKQWGDAWRQQPWNVQPGPQPIPYQYPQIPGGGLLTTPTAGPQATGKGLVGPAPGGLLQPVIWDRLRRGLDQNRLTEGATPNYGGGGRGMPAQAELPLQGGREISRNTQYRAPEKPPEEPTKWKWTEYGDQRTVDTPSGVRVLVTDEPRRGGADVVFYQPGGFRAQAGRLGGEANPSTKQGIQRFSDVFDAVKDYVSKYDPRALTFSGATLKHEKLYDRVAPLMAKDLGGTLHRNIMGEYTIELPGGSDD